MKKVYVRKDFSSVLDADKFEPQGEDWIEYVESSEFERYFKAFQIANQFVRACSGESGCIDLLGIRNFTHDMASKKIKDMIRDVLSVNSR